MPKLTKRSSDYSKWYNEIVVNAGLAEASGVRGCMVIKPYGFAIWERMQQRMDQMFKDTGHSNAYFPLFIPQSYFSKEASHVEGFAKECAVVTHYRLKQDENKKIVVDEDAKLEEPLIVRPTSETIIWDTYKRWVQSYRDLPILVNQWCNVVRWEMRTRLFLRTSEFLWQEGHTAHTTKQEAVEEAETILKVYTDFVQDFLRIPVLQGVKTESERFAGADETYCIEALMQDGKALQAGTSHFLGQNFAKAFDVKYANQNGEEEYVWATSWGTSTRMMGALIMTHSDDAGLVLPPDLAPIQVVIVPIYRSQEDLEAINEYVDKITEQLKGVGIRYKYDNSDNHKPGWKFSEYELKGVPLRLAVGMRDIENQAVEVARRDTLSKERVPVANILPYIQEQLNQMDVDLYQKALNFKKNNTFRATGYEDFKKKIEAGGFVYAHWDGTIETEDRIKNETKATIRCIPLERPEAKGKCILTGKPSDGEVVFAKAY